MQSTSDTRPEGELTGRKVFLIFTCFFGVMMAVNFFMAYRAISTFPGLEVSSSYADGQDFNLRRDAQEALGWQASVVVDRAAGELQLTLVDEEGTAAIPAQMTALLTRPTNRQEDQDLQLALQDGVYVAPVSVSAGRWRLRLTGAAQDGTAYRHNITFTLRD